MKKKSLLLLLACTVICAAEAQLNISFLGNLPYTPDVSDIWGYVDSLGNEYAIVGIQNGVSVVDVTVPTAPTEIYFISGPGTIWRDIKVWNKHAYVTNEGSGGVQIIDLSLLPNPAFPTVTTFSGSSYPFSTAHDLYIDENGIAYILGSDYGNGGAILLDLNSDPMNPVELGIFNTYYLHDAMVRGDTLWGAAINNGFFVVLDVSNKSAPAIMATQNTPGNFTHNCWLSDDGNTLFTTDEKSNAYITSYDVSDLFNIQELDRVQSNPGTGTIVHNTFFINNYLVTSYYRDGVTIHDVTRPGNMIQTGFYDTYPAGAGNGFNGAWGVYPWLPSGNIIVSDIENGLFVLGPNYIRGCYLEGTVTDINTSNPIASASIEILSTTTAATSDLTGAYATSILTAGTYQVVFSAPGYTSDTLTTVLSNGVLTVLNAQLVAPVPLVLNGQVIEANGGNPIPGASVLIANNDYQFSLTADGSGNFSIASFFDGSYEVIAGKWLYRTTCFNQYIDSNANPVIIELDSGLYDDFSFDFGWGVSGNAATGVWERGEPIGTDWIGTGDANPDVDVSADCYDQAYITGNGGGAVGDDDVDNGNTIVKSPLFDATAYSNPYVKYYRWFFNDGGSGTPNDTLEVRLSNGAVTAVLEQIHQASPGNSSWVPKSFRISDYLTPTNTMQLAFETADYAGSGHLVEAGLDVFQVEDYTATPVAVDASCNGVCDGIASVTATGGIPPLSYFWDDPAVQTTDTAIGLCAGTYTATVVDALGDTATALVLIAEPASINITFTTTSFCSASLNQVTAFPSNGTAPYNYVWNDPGGQTTQTAAGLNAGTFWVTVTDNNGCTNSDSVTVANTGLSVTTSGLPPSSCGAADGTATVSVLNGTPPYSYLWSDSSSQSSAVAVGLGPGTYSVIVTDSAGCSDTGTVTLNDPGSPALAISSTSMPLCNGGNEGSATVSVSGAAGPFAYFWNTSPVQTDSTATGLTAGTYSVSVTDGGACTASLSVTIGEPALLLVSATGTDPLCSGEQSGTAAATGSGGAPPLTYIWSTGQSGAYLDSLPSGTYQVSVQDSNGCVSSADTVVLTSPPPLAVNAAVTDAVCTGDSNGAIDITASGGVTPYYYGWSEGSVTEDLTGLQAGTYLLVLSDANGCSMFQNVVVGTKSTGAQAGPITGAVVVNQGSDEFYAVAPHSGSMYNWGVSGGYQTGGGQGNSITVHWNSPGSGQVTVVESDSLGCTGDTVYLLVEIGIGITQPATAGLQSFSVWPNPTAGQFMVTLVFQRETKAAIGLYAFTGQLIRSMEIDQDSGSHALLIDMNGYARGIYYLQVVTDEGVIARKVIYQ